MILAQDFSRVETIHQHGLAALQDFYFANFCLIPRLRVAQCSARKLSEKEIRDEGFMFCFLFSTPGM